MVFRRGFKSGYTHTHTLLSGEQRAFPVTPYVVTRSVDYQMFTLPMQTISPYKGTDRKPVHVTTSHIVPVSHKKQSDSHYHRLTTCSGYFWQ